MTVSESPIVTVNVINHGRCGHVRPVWIPLGWSGPCSEKILKVSWIFKKINFLNFFQPILVQTRSLSLYTGFPKESSLGHFTQDFPYKKKSVFCNYIQNEMRSAKMKSFRLNRILRRIFGQSFEEIGEPSVVGRRSSVV